MELQEKINDFCRLILTQHKAKGVFVLVRDENDSDFIGAYSQERDSSKAIKDMVWELLKAIALKFSKY